jgi:hypothetical protein
MPISWKCFNFWLPFVAAVACLFDALLPAENRDDPDLAGQADVVILVVEIVVQLAVFMTLWFNGMYIAQAYQLDSLHGVRLTDTALRPLCVIWVIVVVGGNAVIVAMVSQWWMGAGIGASAGVIFVMFLSFSFFNWRHAKLKDAAEAQNAAEAAARAAGALGFVFAEQWNEAESLVATTRDDTGRTLRSLLPGETQRVLLAVGQGLIAYGELTGRGDLGVLETRALFASAGQGEAALYARAIRLYTTNWLYRDINAILRSQFCLTEDARQKSTLLAPYMVLLNFALERLDSHVADATFYRGICFAGPQQLVDEYVKNIGRTIVYPAFTSVSFDRNAALGFAGTAMINVKVAGAAVPAVHLDSENLSQYPYEKEVLFPSGVALRVANVEPHEPPEDNPRFTQGKEQQHGEIHATVWLEVVPRPPAPAYQPPPGVPMYQPPPMYQQQPGYQPAYPQQVIYQQQGPIPA